MLVIVDNLCNNYCNIFLNSTCRDFLYKRTPGHVEKGRRKWRRENFRDKNRGQTKNLTLFSLLKKRLQWLPPSLAKNKPTIRGPPPFWYIFFPSLQPIPSLLAKSKRAAGHRLPSPSPSQQNVAAHPLFFFDRALSLPSSLSNRLSCYRLTLKQPLHHRPSPFSASQTNP